eukprot:8100397-Ditylum_brightwellii.AAC.1
MKCHEEEEDENKLGVLGMHMLIFHSQECNDEEEGVNTITLPYSDGPKTNRQAKIRNESSAVIDLLSSSSPPLSSQPDPTSIRDLLFDHHRDKNNSNSNEIETTSCSYYDESIQYAEDYDLWLRLSHANCTSIRNMPRLGLWHRKHGTNNHCGSQEKNQSSSNSNDNMMEDENMRNGIKKKTLIQKQEAHKVAAHAMRRLLMYNNEKNNSTKTATIEGGRENSNNNNTFSTADKAFLHIASILRSPENATCARDLDDAAILLLELEQCFFMKNRTQLSAREVELIQYDCNERLGEIATILVSKYGRAATKNDDGGGGGNDRTGAWGLWCKRCPDLQLERIALFCNSK